MPKIIVANWKSNKNIESAKEWVEEFGQLAVGGDADIVIAPPYTLLETVKKELENKKIDIELGVQDLSLYPAGSYTGAVSPPNLNYLNVKYAVLGHSERRKYFRETSMEVAQKVELAIDAQITPIVCVDKEYIQDQANRLKREHLKDCIVAYEPQASIGNGNEEDVGKVKEMVEEIKKAFGDVPVLYGGSVDESNVGEYMLVCDGALVGTAALNAKEFAGVVNRVK
jgi:triosephosphate isomerase (TIM)